MVPEELVTFQKNWVKNLRSGSLQHDASRFIAPVRVENRFELYRSNFRNTIADLIANHYPAFCAVLGASLSREHLESFIPDLMDGGLDHFSLAKIPEKFAEYALTVFGRRTLLSDLAVFEFAIFRVRYADEHSEVCELRSEFPLLALWALTQGEDPDPAGLIERDRCFKIEFRDHELSIQEQPMPPVGVRS